MSHLDDGKENHLSEIESVDEFISTKASSSLRVCCYGSSSSTTPKVSQIDYFSTITSVSIPRTLKMNVHSSSSPCFLFYILS
jgi:hypothetical protein